jgi:hypothetical protein
MVQVIPSFGSKDAASVVGETIYRSEKILRSTPCSHAVVLNIVQLNRTRLRLSIPDRHLRISVSFH